MNTPGEKAARHILNVLLATFADNKIVEDLHGNLRNEARSKVSKKMSFSTMQSVVRSASVLENRSIRHPAKLKKEQFDRDWKDPRKQPRTKLKYVHEAGRHKMGKHWHHVMGPKDGVHFLKRLWNKVQQLGDGFNTIHQESVHLM